MPAVRSLFDVDLLHSPDYSHWLPEHFPFAPPGCCSQRDSCAKMGMKNTAQAFASELANRFENGQGSTSPSRKDTLTQKRNRRVESLMRTPEPKQKHVFHYNTPDVKKPADNYTPPRGLRSSLLANDKDIELALQQESVDLLSLALLRSHYCTCGHPLHAAVQRGNLKAVELLLKHDMSNIDDTCGGLRPLHLAVKASADTGNQIFETLLQYKANPNFLEGDDTSLNCPLLHATSRGRSGLVRMLLQHGADSDFQGSDGSTALHIACKQLTLHKKVMSIMFLECIQCLLTSDADPHKIDDKGHVPGDYLEEWNHKDILLRAGFLRHKRTVALVSRNSFNSMPLETFNLIALFV